MSARELALEVLERVEEQEAWTRPALEAAFSRRRLSAADRAFAAELAYGTLRWRARLDHALGHHVRRGLPSVEPGRLRSLRLGTYQLLFTRVKPHAAVHETVDLARRRGKEPAARFVNAVLRALIRAGGPPPLPDPASDAVAHLALRESFPRWLIERLVGEVGLDEAATIAAAQNQVLPLVIRANTRRIGRDALAERLRAEGATVAPTPFAPQGLVAQDLGEVGASAAFAEGLFVVQGESSQLVADLVPVCAGDTVLDACAAPGGKATALAERVGEGRVDALELHPHRAELIRATSLRLGLAAVRVRVGDATLPMPGAPAGGYDAALVDAPCSGLGVLRRHPEAKWRGGPELIERMAALQRRLLAAVAAQVRPGGTLVYAVCTFTPEETEAVVRDFLAVHPAYQVEPVTGPFAEGGFFRVHAHRHPMDGFFAARLRRTAG